MDVFQYYIYQATDFLGLAISVSWALFNSFLVLYICNLICNFYHFFICYCMHGFLGYQIFVCEETLCWNNYLSVYQVFGIRKYHPLLITLVVYKFDWFFFFFGPVIMSRPSPALPWGLDLPMWCIGCINNTVSFLFFFFVFSHCITKEAQTTVKRCIRRKETSTYCCFTWGTWKWISKGAVSTTVKPV